VTVRGKKDVTGCDFSRCGENAISSTAEVFVGRSCRLNLCDRHVGLEVQGSGFDE